MQPLGRDNSIEETSPLLRQDAESRGNRSHGRRGCQIPIRFSGLSNSRLVPILGIMTVFVNEAEFFFKEPATLRMLEALSCLEYYTRLDDPLAQLGKNIPELLCKKKAIQERVALLFGVCYAVRMSAGLIGTFVFLSFFNTGRRRPVLWIHKLNLMVAGGLVLVGCTFSRIRSNHFEIDHSANG